MRTSVPTLFHVSAVLLLLLVLVLLSVDLLDPGARVLLLLSWRRPSLVVLISYEKCVLKGSEIEWLRR